MLKSFFAIFLILIALGCSENSITDLSGDLSDSVYILHDLRDTSLHSYYEEIMESDEFINWRFNSNNPDTSKTVGFFRLQNRTLKIQDKIYFEADLISYTSVPPQVSTIPIKHVCTFRFDLKQKNIKIFNQLTEKFIDYRTLEGKKYFKTCLDK